MIATQSGPDAPEGRLVDRALEQLRAHPVYLEVCGPLAAATVPNDPADPTPIIEPLLTTRDGLILEGHERWAVARQQGRPSLPCIEYDLTGEEALTFMLEQHRRSERLNDFCRIVMALALEPHWRARARERQRQGGTGTLSSKLTKGHAIDVRGGARTRRRRGCREAAATTIDTLKAAIATALDAFTPSECANYFTNSGYKPDRSENALAIPSHRHADV